MNQDFPGRQIHWAHRAAFCPFGKDPGFGEMTWLNNLESTGQITAQESKDLLTLAEKLNIYNLVLTEYSFLLVSSDLYLHPSTLPKPDRDQKIRVKWS